LSIRSFAISSFIISDKSVKKILIERIRSYEALFFAMEIRINLAFEINKWIMVKNIMHKNEILKVIRSIVRADVVK